jgi:hypothetical protein
MATDFATAVANQNNVAGSPAQFINGTPTVSLTFGLPGTPNVTGNPRITVTLQRTGLPLFFAKIFGNSVASVSATAMAEAYNPAYSEANNGGAFIPPAPKCVKPFLLRNNDPNQVTAQYPFGVPFVDPTTGAINPAANSFIGETLTLSSACGVGQSGCKLKGPPNSPTPPQPGEYLPMVLPSPHKYCPSDSAPACSSGVSDFQQSTQCCDGNTFDFQQCGVSGTLATWDPSINPGGQGGPAQSGLQCLIHTTSTGLQGNPQQDVLDVTSANTGPLRIEPGTYTQSLHNVSAEQLVGTSDSIITVPLFDPASWSPSNNQVTIVGFLQLFVNYVPTPGGGPQKPDMNAYILNVVGCGSSLAPVSAISGGGVSAIPVRLIQN